MLTHPPSEADLRAANDDQRAREADLTPRPVVRACVRDGWANVRLARHTRRAWFATTAFGMLQGAWVEFDAGRPLRVLDLCAGAGVWGDEVVRYLVWCGVPREWIHLVAVEVDEREREHLERTHDEVIIGGWAAAFAYCRLRADYDLVIGNTPFTIAHGRKVKTVDDSCIAVARAAAPIVALFLTTNSLRRGEVGADIRRAHPPMIELDVEGSIKFRKRGSKNPATGKPWGAATDQYSLRVWARAWAGLHGHPVTYSAPVRRLSASERSWSIRPGTETDEEIEAMFAGWES